MKKNIVIIVSALVFIAIVVLVTFQMNKMAKGRQANLQQRISKLEKIYKQDSARLRRTTYMKDSIAVVANYLSKYWALADALYERDSVRVHLKYKVGDVVRVKWDSSKAVVTDIIIGGSKYEYYVKYRLKFRDKSVEEVLPELLYE